MNKRSQVKCCNLYLISYRCSFHGYLNLNIWWNLSHFFFYSTMPDIYLMLYQLVPHIVVETFSYFSYSLFIVFLRVSYLFLIVYRYIYSSRQVLYFYALPIDHLLTPFSSLCLSCNVSQA